LQCFSGRIYQKLEAAFETIDSNAKKTVFWFLWGGIQKKEKNRKNKKVGIKVCEMDIYMVK